ncbi:hypothetical protein KFL_002550140 [Klebsormidium nitens]|uniref:HIT-type domain-containing protein n=1 Tax=Klebsormidium nitens TaxID=105231 RepID=A0A1Y1IAR9_KLENI|nr:hypothetical protein KFL_002550140 [Klebsormidium nitens]|eukprot:GAQ85807.1 hypothetical protein KFL_002550140 [Klebsormidium nitens]
MAGATQPAPLAPVALDQPMSNPSKILFQQETELPAETSGGPNTDANVASPSPKTLDGASQAPNVEAPPPESSSREGPSGSPPKRRKLDEPCGFCNEQTAKYRCPGCGVQTCSLECSKGHKERTGCKGQRNKTAMVKMAEFDENNLISDYNFLEEALRQNEASRRMRGTFEGGPYSRTPGKLMALITQARNRRIELILLSSDLSRRKANTSYYDKKRKCFFWRIEWVFPSAQVQLATTKLDEHQPPLKALGGLLEARPGNAALRHKLRDYCAAGADTLTFLLRKDCCKASEQVYYKIDPSRPLRKLLERKTLIEFPVITVALPSEAGSYTLEEEEPESSESAWGASSEKGWQSDGNIAALVDPRVQLYAEKPAEGGGEVGADREEGNGPPEEVPIVRGRDGAEVGGGKGGGEGGGDEDVPDVELAALLAKAAMADFNRKRKKMEEDAREARA